MAEALIVPLTHFTTTKYSQVAATALIGWDYLITFDQEVEYFWKGKWTVTKYLFFANRYWSMSILCLNTIAILSPDVTDQVSEIAPTLSNKPLIIVVVSVWYVSIATQLSQYFQLYLMTFQTGKVFIRYIITSFGAIEIFLVQAILSLRVHAMYGRDKYVGFFLAFLWLGTAVSAIVVVDRAMEPTVVTAHPAPGLVFCATPVSPDNIWAFFVPILIFEATVFILAAYRSIAHFRSHQGMGQTMGVKLIQVILRDSVVYFFVILISYLTDAMIWRFAPGTLLNVVHGLTIAIAAIGGTRMLLNLRAEGKEGRGPSHIELGSLRTQPHTEINVTRTYSRNW